MTKRRTMLVALLAVLAVLFSAVAFSACKKDDSTPGGDNPPIEPPVKYTVTFESDSAIVKTVEIVEGKTLLISDVPATPVKNGYEFDGWFNGSVEFDRSAAVTANVTYAAKWTKLYTVRFVDGEEVVKSATVRDGEKLESSDVPFDPVKSGSIFEGWYNGSAEFDVTAIVTADVTYAAKWDNLLTVKFANGTQTVKVVNVKKGDKLTEKDIPADLAIDGRIFEGWFVGENAFDKNAAITEDVTVTAKWTNVYVVKFVVDGRIVKIATVKDGEKLETSDIPSDPVSDRTFLGWFNGDKQFDPNAVITSGVEYTAVFSNIDEKYYGIWRGETTDDKYNSISVAVVIDAESITVTIGDAPMVADNITYNEEYDSYDFTLNGANYSFGPYLNGYCITSMDDNSLNAMVSKELSTSFGTSKSLVGTFTTESGIEIIINSTFVLIDGEQGLDLRYSEGGYSGASYSFYLGNSSCSIYYSNGWILDLGGVTDNIIVPEPEAKEVAEVFKGVWSGVYESRGQKAVFFMKVTDDSEVYVYTVGLGYSKVGIIIESSDEAFTIWSMDGIVTVSLNDDGSLHYASDGAYGIDVDNVTKEIRLAFEYNYQIVYVATLKDGKVDSDTFGLDDPDVKLGYTFNGWFNDINNEQFNESATYTDNNYFIGAAEQTHYVVKYVNGKDETTKLVPVDNAKLTADLIAQAPATGEGEVFLGWYKGDVKAEAGLKISSDTTFTALSVKESDYVGAWILENKAVMVTIGSDGKASATSANIYARNVDYKFNGETGAIEFRKKSGMVDETWTIVKTVTGVSLTELYYDMDYEACTETYALTALKGTTKVPAATYRADRSSSYIIVGDNAVITKFNNADVFGFITGASATTLTVKYKENAASGWKTVSSVAYTSKNGINFLRLGKLNTDPALYSKDSTVSEWYNSVNRFYLYEHNANGKKVYTVRDTNNHYGYASVNGEVLEGEIITITYELYGGNSTKTKYSVNYKVSGTSLIAAGAEKGEYKCGADTIVFDGFGNAKKGVETHTYFVNGAGIVVMDNNVGYKLNAENATCEQLASDGKAGNYTQFGNDKYTLVIDGFGGATITYKSSYGSPSVYSGLYTISSGKLTITKTSYTYNKTYTIEEEGKVLVSTDNKVVFTVNGHVIESKIEEFVGEYENGSVVIKITVSNGTPSVVINGENATSVKANYNGTLITFAAKDFDSAAFPSTKIYSWSAKLAEGNLVVTHECIKGMDEYGEDFEYETKVATYTKKTASTETDGLEGTYKAGGNVITLDGKGNGTYNNGTEYPFTYSGTGNVKKVSNFAGYDDGENTITVVDGNIKVHFSGSYGDDVYNAVFTKQADTDGLEGTYKAGSNVLTLDGKGNGTYNGTAFTYTGAGNNKKVSDFGVFTDGENAFTVNDDGSLQLHLSGDYGDNVYNAKFVKQ